MGRRPGLHRWRETLLGRLVTVVEAAAGQWVGRGLERGGMTRVSGGGTRGGKVAG